jgi:hypothetical protein
MTTIDALSSIQIRSGTARQQPVTTLEARLKTAIAPREDAANGVDAPSQPDFDSFYLALLRQDENFNALEFLKNYVGADGDKTFRTTAAQMEVLQLAMARLKEEGQIDSDAYKSAMKAFGSAYSMNFMLSAYMRDAMNPSDDEDSRENIEW